MIAFRFSVSPSPPLPRLICSISKHSCRVAEPHRAAPLLPTPVPHAVAPRSFCEFGRRTSLDASMSHAKQNDDEGAPASRTPSAPMQPRDGEDEEKQHAAQPPAHVSPAMRLYRHALESIFGMLELSDLVRVIAVSRQSSAAVRSMKTINASLERSERTMRALTSYRPLPPVSRIVASPLLRHLASVRIRHEGEFWTPLDTASLALLTQHAPNLQSLWCALTLTSHDPLVLPAKLASL